jgi:hypothetical protein
MEWIDRETAEMPPQGLMYTSGPTEGIPARELGVFMRWVEKSQEGH